ncbi:MAG: chemotaxis protein CheA [Clostridiales bacterium]|nr:chemotaxis protein CheA [Clostridiales bacterium]
MTSNFIDEPMLQAYLHETSQILETLEQEMIQSEMGDTFTEDSINVIFRYMHTIKGSSSMMMYNNISGLAHVLEDMFYIIRKENNLEYDFSSLVDLVLESIDFFKIELIKVKNKDDVDGDPSSLKVEIENLIQTIKVKNGLIDEKEIQAKKQKQKYYIRPSTQPEQVTLFQAVLSFEDGCEMENIRAYSVVQNALEFSTQAYYFPNDIIDNELSAEVIRKDGFKIIISTLKPLDEVKSFFESTIFLKDLTLQTIEAELFNKLSLEYQQEASSEELSEEIKVPKTSKKYKEKKEVTEKTKEQAMISVHVEKLDKLMNMVGELVIAESMVTQNPEVTSLEIESFDKASRQLQKISADLQDMVMGIRMVPLSTTFMKMHRIVRDMNRKLGKEVVLDVIGEETEVDKSIIEKISDPLMHIIRNAIDHGIEPPETRIKLEKSEHGLIHLEARNSGSNVLIIIKDDGKGLNKNKIYKKAFSNGLTDKAFEELKESDIFQFILNPGFSTNEAVTEFSGRGVGMDVVCKNIGNVGGSVIVESEEQKGTTITLKIPLTLAIIDGMNLKVGDSRFTLPLMTIKESFRPKSDAVFKDPSGLEMIMLRGECYPVLRLHKHYDIPTDITSCDEGILIMIEEDGRSSCLFADELLGQQQVVVKTLPNYIKQYKNVKGLSGCTLLGDGNISLILDVKALNVSTVMGGINGR